jgi:hypothetical protein
MIDISSYITSTVANSTNVSGSSVTSYASDDYVDPTLANAGLSTTGQSSNTSSTTNQTTISMNGTDYTVANSGAYSASNTGSDIVSSSQTASSTTSSSTTSSGSTSDDIGVDARLRISALSGRESDIYGTKDTSNIMYPLYASGGFLFPYTPSISASGESAWTSHDLVHQNFDILSYQRTPSAQISLTGKFTVQNFREGEYAIAAIHFLRTMTKMHYGANSTTTSSTSSSTTTSTSASTTTPSTAGTPPPVLRLRGYGTYMFNDLRCVIKGYSFTFDENANLVWIETTSGGTVWLPPLFNITVNIALQYSPTKIRKDFNLETFRTGEALRSTKGNWF